MHIAKCSPLLDVRFLLPNFPHPQPQIPMSVFPLQHSVDVLLSPASSLKEVKSLPAYHLLDQRLKSDLQLEFQQIDIGSDGHDLSKNQKPQKSSPPLMQPCSDVALGGTFDGIHDGHRLLLTQSALITTSRILVGIASGPLLASKVLPELIKPVKERIFEVKSLLADIKPWIQHQVEEIVDVYGPTAWDEGLLCLVVTPDTARGGEKVNAERKRKVGTCTCSLLDVTTLASYPGLLTPAVAVLVLQAGMRSPVYEANTAVLKWIVNLSHQLLYIALPPPRCPPLWYSE